jgi:prefoldin subunit 1
MIPRSTMEKDLKSQEKALTDDINSLGKKASSSALSCLEIFQINVASQVKYLEKQFNDAQSQLRDIVCVYVIPLDVLNLKVPQFNSAPKQ